MKYKAEIVMAVERPIIFNSQMVRAILEGRKSQTRRIIKPQPESGEDEIFCPYQPGQRLWVKETFAYIWPEDCEDGIIDGRVITDRECNIEYRADTGALYPGDWPADEAKGNPEALKWQPSIHMPRWASRITLEITNIRVERVQQIKNSEKDCEEEGIDFHWDGCPKTVECDCSDLWYWEFFKHYWDSIYAKKGYGWDENPFVFVIEFRRSDDE